MGSAEAAELVTLATATATHIDQLLAILQPWAMQNGTRAARIREFLDVGEGPVRLNCNVEAKSDSAWMTAANATLAFFLAFSAPFIHFDIAVSSMTSRPMINSRFKLFLPCCASMVSLTVSTWFPAECWPQAPCGAA